MWEGGGGAALWLLTCFVGIQGYAIAQEFESDFRVEFEEIHPVSDFNDILRQNFGEMEKNGRLTMILEALEADRFDSWPSHGNRRRRETEGNQNPSFVKPLKIQVVIGELVSVRIHATDPDGDNMTISLANPSIIGSVTSDGIFTTHHAITGNVGDYIDAFMSIKFKVEDGKGGTDYISPEWDVCNCVNDGYCDFESILISAHRLNMYECHCLDAYDGNMCQNDRDGCVPENKCFEGVTCFDEPAPLSGFRCGPCPKGLRGDGITCDSTCAIPDVVGGTVHGNAFNIGSSIEIECSPGYLAAGKTNLTCLKNLEYDSPVPTCEDLDECSHNPCHVNAKCDNYIGSFFCICDDGFVGDGVKSCEPTISFDYFSCEVMSTNSIRVSWQILPKNSPSLDQIIVSWRQTESLDLEKLEELDTYYYEFDEYDDMLNKEGEHDQSLVYQALNGNVTSFTVPGLTPGSPYMIRLRAKMSFGVADNPTRTCIRSTENTLPGPPTELIVTKTGTNDIHISWKASENNYGIVLGYTIEYQQTTSCMDEENNCTTMTQVLEDKLNAVLTDLTPGALYKIRVATVNYDGIGAFSDPVESWTMLVSRIGVQRSARQTINADTFEGKCFDVSFFLTKELKNLPTQQNLFSENVKNTLRNGLKYLQYGTPSTGDVVLSEVADKTHVKVHVWLPDVPNEVRLTTLFRNIKRNILMQYQSDPWLQHLNYRSVRVESCESCAQKTMNDCGDGTTCVDMNESFFCQCLPGYSPVRPSHHGNYPVSCKSMIKGRNSNIESKSTSRIHIDCERAKYDILFLVDSSRSVTKTSLQSTLTSIKDFISNFIIGPSGTQFALALYAHDVKVEFYFDEYSSLESLQNALDNVTSSGSGTRTAYGALM